MNVKIGDDDGRAVDLLLDGLGNSRIGGPIASGMMAQRLECISRLLDVLDHMPAAEPPHGLVARTLARIEEAAVAQPAGRAATTPPPRAVPITPGRSA